MDVRDAVECAWKNGYVAAITDMQKKNLIDPKTFQTIVNELLSYRGMSSYIVNEK